MRRGERKYAERDAEIVRLRLAGHALGHIAADFGLSVERVRQIALRQERQAQSDAWRALWDTTEPAVAEPDEPPEPDLITREAVRLFRNQNPFLSMLNEEFREGYVWHIRGWHAQPGARIGAKLRIHLPNEYTAQELA